VYLKADLCKARPRNLDVLKAATVEKITAILSEATDRVMKNFSLRLTICTNNGGHHMPDVIFS